MAKLHSELRIKAVNNIIGGTEGDPVNFSEGDIVYDLTSDKFKVLDNLGAWQDAVTGVSADLSATSVSALQDINFNAVALDGANGEGKVLAWSESEQAFVPVDVAGGAGDAISLNDTAVTITDTGSDGNIELKTDNVVRWNIGPQGHLIPATNNAFDIGSAELKVRDMYVSDASLWIGDEHKVAISEGKMKFLKRRKDKMPSGVNENDVSINDVITFADATFGGNPLAGKTLATMELADWKLYAEARGIPFENIYNKDEVLDWEQDDSQVDSVYIQKNSSNAVSKEFDVAVDNKGPNFPGSGGGSANGYYINGVPHPELRLKAGTYRFYQRHPSNDNHPFSFYTTEGKDALVANQTYGFQGGAIVDNATYAANLNGSLDLPADAHYVQIVVDETLPAEFYYQCGAHAYMGWKVINEAASAGGGAASSDELSDMSTAGAEDGEALVYNAAQSRFEPQPIMTADASFASEFVLWTADADTRTIHQFFAGKMGGRIVIDDVNYSEPNDMIELNLHELYGNPLRKSMNFEIFSVGTKPFRVTMLNDDGNVNQDSPEVVARDFFSYVQPAGGPNTTVAPYSGNNILVGEGQMLIIFCDGTRWRWEIRSGL